MNKKIKPKENTDNKEQFNLDTYSNDIDKLNNNKNINDNSSNIFEFINKMPFANLNDYYDIKTSLFLKHIEELNLKFFWASESILTHDEIKYPYNKLFLILFKEISLYIDEIERLNKQLKLKNKNESYYTQKISQLNEKEKINISNKQILKNLQRNYNLLQKANDKYKINIEKLNKKLNYYTNTNKLNKYVVNYNNNECKSSIGNQTMVNTTLDSFNAPNSLILNSNKNENKRKTLNKKNEIKNSEMSEIIKSGINQCDEELKNLTKIEELLMIKSKKKSNLITRSNSRNKLKYKIFNKTIK